MLSSYRATSSGPITPSQRFRRSQPCPVCGGYDAGNLRARGGRCWGFVSGDGTHAICTRSERAGKLPMQPGTSGFLHALHGACPCGINHDLSMAPVPVLREASHRARQGQSDQEWGEIKETYEYTDEHGHPLYRVLRYRNPKGFSQQRFENGGWKWGLRGIKPVLYHLPAVLSAQASAMIYLPEGEKDVHALEQRGCVATTNAGGGNSWRRELARSLRGRNVVILEDNDAAGRVRTDTLVETLTGVAQSVRVGWFPNTVVGYDVSDWLSDGLTVENIPTYKTEAWRLEPQRRVA